MVEIRKVNEFLKKTDKFIENPEEIMNIFAVEKTDHASRCAVLELIIEVNRIVLMKKRKKLKEIQELSSTFVPQSSIDSNPEKPKKSTQKQKIIVPMNNNVSQYISLINEGYDLEEIVDDILKLDDSTEILNQILLVIFGEIKTYNDLAKDEDLKTKTEAIEELHKLKDIVLYIQSKLECSEELDESEYETENENTCNAFFYKTPQGNIEFLSDLKDIPSEAYSDVKDCLVAILECGPKKTGKFSKPPYQGMFKSKMNQIRITYAFIQGKCVILGVFVKKQNFDQPRYFANAMRLQKAKSNQKFDFDELEALEEAGKILDYIDENIRWVK